MSGSMEESESVSLVKREASVNYTEEGARGFMKNEDDDTNIQETDYLDTDVSLLSQFHEDAISQAGFGKFQWLLFIVVGLGLAADTVEIFVVAYILPSAEKDLCMEDVHKGWLGAITLAGMVVGGIIWGSLSDHIGRRSTLMSSLSVNALFAVIAAFMPTYGLFMCTRFLCGLGLGGSIPIVFSYYSEFLDKNGRGRHLTWLLNFWAIGGIFVALMAWAIIPRTGFFLLNVEKTHFSNWRIFLLVCALPSVASILGLIVMPESPRFLLEVGRDVEAISVYQRVFRMNHSSQKVLEYQLTELELPRRNPDAPTPVGRGLVTEFISTFDTFWASFLQLFCPPLLRITLLFGLLNFVTCFGYYGLSFWFPEYIKHLQVESYLSSTKSLDGGELRDQILNETLDNINYNEYRFDDVQFTDLTISHVTFSNSSFVDCTFSNVRSGRSFFEDSTFVRTRFVDTDFHDYRFRRCQFHNSSFLNTKPGCSIDFALNYDLSKIFLQNLIGQLSMIPGTIVASLIIDRFGRSTLISTSLFLTGFASLFIWFIDTVTAVIVFQATFNFLFIIGFNTLDVSLTEVFPAHLRSTGYGTIAASCRIGGMLGNIIFGQFIGVSRAVPMVTTTVVLIIGGLTAIKIPETRDNLM
ncbi:SV2A (predicted) [Pycnogonum litorale]